MCMSCLYSTMDSNILSTIVRKTQSWCFCYVKKLLFLLVKKNHMMTVNVCVFFLTFGAGTNNRYRRRVRGGRGVGRGVGRGGEGRRQKR